MTTGEWISMGSLAVAALAVILAFTRGRKTETEAFITVKVLLDQLSKKVDAITRRLDETGSSMSSCDKDIALLKQRMDSVESRLDQHLNTHPPNARAAE